MRFSEKAAQNLMAIRNTKPLIHNITNFVVMNFSANALLSMGASPVMAHAHNEVEEMVALSGSLVLNIGTLTDEWVSAMIKAGKRANDLNIPVILDPVGSGATSFRTASAKKILAATTIRVIRGNPSEIISLSDRSSMTKGVDSVHTVEDAFQPATSLASELGTTLAITGPKDLITDGKKIVRVLNGHPLMGRVTGTGCVATAITGAFLAVDPDPVRASATALSFFGLAGEIAAQSASAPGSFMAALLDSLYRITPEMLEKGCRIVEE
ncbi:MAG: hydroxyethylthiazole kinase [Pseudomonadota bacterium]